MRLIDLGAGEVRTAAVSPDGRFLAASGAGGWLSVFEWATGKPILRAFGTCDQFAFLPDGHLAHVHDSTLRLEPLEPSGPGATAPALGGNFAGGVAVSADGKALLASRAGPPGTAKLDKWALPSLWTWPNLHRRQPGFDGLSPFRKLALSPNGAYLAGIWSGIERRRPEPARFELRYAASGGLDLRYPPTGGRACTAAGFVSFSHDSGTCAFGWEGEFHVLDISTGTSRYLRRVEASFRDAAFTGSGRLFATAEAGGALKMWDPRSWQVVREYDWGCGPLSCLAFTADGTAGVCGTTGGQLVLFDVDE